MAPAAGLNILPNFEVLCDLSSDLSSYGNVSEKWVELESSLKVAFANFFVVDAASEHHLARMRTIGNQKMDHSRQGIILWLATNGAAVPAMQQLLQLGLDPDLVSSHKRMRASHWSSFHGLANVAEVLGVCRVDLLAEETSFRVTPEDLARKYASEKETADEKDRYSRTSQVWDEFARNGFPSVARLVAERKYWAAQNLCRRRLVPELEKQETFRGKTAIEWAIEHGKTALASELEYLLQAPSGKRDIDVGTGSKQDCSQHPLTDQVTQLVSLALAITSKAQETGSLKQEVSKLQLQLDQEKNERARLQYEVDLLKFQIADDRKAMMESTMMELRSERSSVRDEMKSVREELSRLPSVISANVVGAMSAGHHVLTNARRSADGRGDC